MAGLAEEKFAPLSGVRLCKGEVRVCEEGY